mmetsp:Transcript_24798/g.45482  ORF Transcript_24798/g.45482 Transcript_24798/m.45482 type:complete len:140 (+) Transcript_24798:70-489(+)
MRAFCLIFFLVISTHTACGCLESQCGEATSGSSLLQVRTAFNSTLLAEVGESDENYSLAVLQEGKGFQASTTSAPSPTKPAPRRPCRRNWLRCMRSRGSPSPSPGPSPPSPSPSPSPGPGPSPRQGPSPSPSPSPSPAR